MGENATIHGHPWRAYAEFDLLHKTTWISDLRLQRTDVEKGVLEDVKLFRLDQSSQVSLKPTDIFSQEII